MRSKRLASSIGLALLLAVVAVAGTRAAPQAQGTEPPGQMTYQGHLMDADGAPVPDGSYMMEFAFYDAPVGGTLLWGPEDKLVDVNDGYFSALMGQTDPIEPSDLADTTYLEITVSGETMTPRHQLTSVAFALVAGSVMSGTVSWDDLADVPAGFADGVDDGTPPDIGDFDSVTMEDDGWIGTGASGPRVVFNSNPAVVEIYDRLAGGDTETSSATGTNAFAWGDNCDSTGDYSSISGGSTNEASADYTTIGGGSGNVANDTYGSVGGGLGNTASGSQSTVGGGDLNEASAIDSLVAGGHNNYASGNYSSVAGGRENIASGMDSVVVGGYDNQATGINSLAAGHLARAVYDGSFVWADYSSPSTLSSDTDNQFIIRASGGIKMYTDSAATTGAELLSGSGSWSMMSDRNLKENVYPVDGQVILDTLAGIEINTWNYISQADSVRHVGPMAQDFYAAFGLGENDTSISAVDADGVALAAIQALYERVLELEAQVAACQCGGE